MTNQKNRTIGFIIAFAIILSILPNTLFAAPYAIAIHKAVYYDANDTLEVAGLVAASNAHEAHVMGVRFEIIPSLQSNPDIIHLPPPTHLEGLIWYYHWSGTLKDKNISIVNSSQLVAITNRQIKTSKEIETGKYHPFIDQAIYFDHNNTLQVTGEVNASKAIYAETMKAKVVLTTLNDGNFTICENLSLTNGSGLTRTFNCNDILAQEEKQAIEGSSIYVYSNRGSFSAKGTTVGNYNVDIEKAIYFDNNKTLFVKGSVTTDINGSFKDHMKAIVIYEFPKGNQRILSIIEPLGGSGNTRSFEKTFDENLPADEASQAKILVDTNRDVQSSKSITTAQYYVGIDQAIFYDVNNTLYITGEVNTTESIFAHTMDIIIGIDSSQNNFHELTRIAPLTEGTGLTRTFEWNGTVPPTYLSGIKNTIVIVQSNRDSENEKIIRVVHNSTAPTIVMLPTSDFPMSLPIPQTFSCFKNSGGTGGLGNCPVVRKDGIEYWPVAKAGGNEEKDIIIIGIDQNGREVSKKELPPNDCRYIWNATLDTSNKQVIYKCFDNKTKSVGWSVYSK